MAPEGSEAPPRSLAVAAPAGKCPDDPEGWAAEAMEEAGTEAGRRERALGQ